MFIEFTNEDNKTERRMRDYVLFSVVLILLGNKTTRQDRFCSHKLYNNETIKFIVINAADLARSRELWCTSSRQYKTMRC